MLELCIVIIFVIISISICLHHHTMKNKLKHVTDIDIGLIRNASELSIEAANTINPIIALTHSIKAVNIIELLHHRYGASTIEELSGVNTIQILKILTNQRDRILNDLISKHKAFNYKKNHPLSTYADSSA